MSEHLRFGRLPGELATLLDTADNSNVSAEGLSSCLRRPCGGNLQVPWPYESDRVRILSEWPRPFFVDLQRLHEGKPWVIAPRGAVISVVCGAVYTAQWDGCDAQSAALSHEHRSGGIPFRRCSGDVRLITAQAESILLFVTPYGS